jgi:hypothetical protein
LARSVHFQDLDVEDDLARRPVVGLDEALHDRHECADRGR